jgi:hypothetical protein
VPSIRKRKDFAAELQSLEGRRLSDCYVYLEIETTIVGDQRDVVWSGRITSFSDPQHTFHGGYLLKPAGAERGSEIAVFQGDHDRRGITSDEYDFRGEDAPPELP